jgi:thioredoxin 1
MADRNEHANVLEITDDTFEAQVRKSAIPFLLDLSAEWCGPCKAIAPLIHKLASEYAGQIAFGTVDIDKNPKIPTEFHVRSIPTLLLFKEGRVLGQLTGAHPSDRIVDLMKKAL